MSTRLSASIFNDSSSNVSYDLPVIYVSTLKGLFVYIFNSTCPKHIYDYVYGIHSSWPALRLCLWNSHQVLASSTSHQVLASSTNMFMEFTALNIYDHVYGIHSSWHQRSCPHVNFQLPALNSCAGI